MLRIRKLHSTQMISPTKVYDTIADLISAAERQDVEMKQLKEEVAELKALNEKKSK